MEDVFDIEVTYGGQQCTYQARLETYGYTYRFHFSIDGQAVLFEPDEEGSYRAYTEPSAVDPKPVEPALIAAIIHTLEDIRS